VSQTKKFISGFAWVYSSQILTQLISFSTTLALARLLMPEDFGLIALIAVYIQIVSLLISGGLGFSLIRMKELTDEDCSTVFWFNFITGFFLYALFYFLAPFLAAFYNQPILTEIVRTLTLLFIIGPLSIVQRARFTHQLDFKTQMKVSMPSALVGSIIGIVMAYNGYGVWSLVFSSLFKISTDTILYWVFSNWKPQLIFKKDRFKFHFLFGINMLMSNLIDTIYLNIYTLIIGKHFSIKQLGYYNQAESLKQMPINNIGFALNKIALPFFTKQQENLELLRKNYKQMMNMVFFIITPVILFMMVFAESIIRLFFSEKWLPAVPYFQILCLAGIFQSLQSFNLNLLIIKGMGKIYFRIEILKKTIMTLVIFISFFYGIYGLLWGHVVYSIISFLINSYFAGKSIDFGLKRQLIDLFPTFFISIITAFLLYFLNFYFNTSYDIWRIILGLIVSIFIYILLAFSTKNDSFNELIKIILSYKKSKKKTSN
jgi:O-antigen/teichoic acid export membrane protein